MASASIPNTEKTSGFRSRLYSAVSRAARLIFSHTSASRARRGRLALAIVGVAAASPTQRSMLSTKAASATRSLPPSASPSACSSRGSTRGSVASSAAVLLMKFDGVAAEQRQRPRNASLRGLGRLDQRGIVDRELRSRGRGFDDVGRGKRP